MPKTKLRQPSALWVRHHLKELVGHLPPADEKWSWSDSPLPHRARCNLRERGLIVKTEDGTWQCTESLCDAVEVFAGERGISSDEIYAENC